MTHQALDPETPAATLRSLAEHPDKQVRMAVALNAEAPPRLLAKLADDRDFDVVLKVAKHPNTPVATIVELASSGHPEVRAEVARNPGTPVPLLMELAGDRERYTRALLARNPSTPTETLDELVSGDTGIRLQVAANPNTAARTLHLLATVPQQKPLCGEDFDCALAYQLTIDGQVRAAVAANPATESDTLSILAGDKERLVLESVCANPNTPAEAFRKAQCTVRHGPPASAPAASVQMWGPWKHTTIGSTTARGATGWRSLRIVGDDYALGAGLRHGSRGVACLLSYHPVRTVPKSPGLVFVVDEDVHLTIVEVFPNLAEARAACRAAVETHAGLNPVPVSDATDHAL